MNAKLEHGAAEAAKVLIYYRNSDSIRQACSVSLQRMKLCISKHARKAMTKLSGEDHGCFEISFRCWYTSSFQGLGLASKFMKRWSCCLNVNLDVFILPVVMFLQSSNPKPSLVKGAAGHSFSSIPTQHRYVFITPFLEIILHQTETN